jgi:hypothetical protein
MAILGVVILLGAVAVGIAWGISEMRKTASERTAGIYRFAICVLGEDEISVGFDTHRVTRDTHAEVVGSAQVGRRSTATRTAAGALVGGVPGALVGHAAKKKTQSSNAVLTIDGPDWTHTVPVPADRYSDAVQFAQRVNLAARKTGS